MFSDEGYGNGRRWCRRILAALGFEVAMAAGLGSWICFITRREACSFDKVAGSCAKAEM